MEFADGVGARMGMPAADGFDQFAGGISRGDGFVLGDPGVPICDSLRVDRPDTRARFDMIGETNAPGLRAYAGPEAILISAHPAIQWIRSKGVEAIGNRRLIRIKRAVGGEHPQAGGGSIDPEIPFGMFGEKIGDAGSGSFFRATF